MHFSPSLNDIFNLTVLLHKWVPYLFWVSIFLSYFFCFVLVFWSLSMFKVTFWYEANCLLFFFFFFLSTLAFRHKSHIFFTATSSWYLPQLQQISRHVIAEDLCEHMWICKHTRTQAHTHTHICSCTFVISWFFDKDNRTSTFYGKMAGITRNIL